MTTEQLITPHSAALILNLSTRKVLALVRRGEVPYVELPDGSVRFCPADLRDWMLSRRKPVTEYVPCHQ